MEGLTWAEIFMENENYTVTKIKGSNKRKLITLSQLSYYK